MKNELSSKELCKSLNTIAGSYKELMPDDKKEGLSIKWGIKVMKQATKAIKQKDKAIEMLKRFAFVDPDDSMADRRNNASDVQKLLIELGYGDWVDNQIDQNMKDFEDSFES